ncbi:EF-hand [Coemansia reversa NRRL 1564]|uniref:Endocytosis protein 3 n=1 Tax=Coemansia reversa (strain ATCC 12441 / NRRL 1564) TaxID=763665 RepID=A0A2G5BLJ9_COERN|nr:EF-hand [Coemansia reversa NRRL 1564]|eukprot:PIA19617.1 EF-hand [Coemansia reversa NRRL 1564]
MNSLSVSAEERQQFQQHFFNANPVDGRIPGAAARANLMQSGLATQQLGEIWELADIDKDGMLDFDEYCIALKLVFSVLHRTISSVPPVLPPSLIPQSKYGYFTSNANVSSNSLQQLGSPQATLPGTLAAGTGTLGQQGGGTTLEWYIPGEDRTRYQSLFAQHSRGSPQVRMLDMEDFLVSLGIPRPTITQAWGLVDVRKYQQLNQEQFVYLMHVLSSHTKGARIPATLPPAVKDAIYNSLNLNNGAIGGTDNIGADTSHGYRYERSGNVALADSYLSKLKNSSTFKNEAGSRYASSSKKAEEEKHLRAELKDLDEELQRIQADQEKLENGSHNDSQLRTAIKELEELKAYKIREKQQAESSSTSNDTTTESLQEIKQSIFHLEGHLSFLQSEQRAIEEFITSSKQELMDLQMKQIKLK